MLFVMSYKDNYFRAATKKIFNSSNMIEAQVNEENIEKLSLSRIILCFEWLHSRVRESAW
jgi:hypothetical protein